MAETAWQQIEIGFTWGPAYSEGWYKVTGVIPEDFAGKTLVLTHPKSEFKWEAWGTVEGTIWKKGVAVGGIDFGHGFYRLEPGAKSVDLMIQTFAPNKETTVHRPEAPRTEKPAEFPGFVVKVLDEAIYPLFFDCEFVFSLMQAQPTTDPAFATLQRALNDVCNTYREGDQRAIAKCQKILRDAQDSLSGEFKHAITPVGHAHLDTAWLWPLSVTHLKMTHTTSIQLDLLARYPEHVFVHTQASQYEWLEKEQPNLFARVQEASKQGRWEVTGSMWVEADCNLTGSESMVRQFLYGRRYFQKHFGVETEDMWLPDVFGYSAALPQILTKFGIKYFLTQKMSWNQTNKIPHNTFWWVGIDGSRVWTHFPPADTYNASCTAQEITESVQKHRDHGRSDRSLYLYGFGDGGGGPTEFHLERLRRARQAPQMPTVESGKKASDFYRRAMAESNDLLSWVGELYFEMHRGTLTSQAANKRNNRKAEFLMRDAEWLWCFRDDFKRYPAAELERLWKVILLNQFHDIIPGSSVREVYEDSNEQYGELLETANAIIKDSVAHIGRKLNTEGMSQPVAIFHNSPLSSEASLPWDQEEVPNSIRCGDESSPVQLVESFGERKLVFSVPSAALGSVAVADLSQAQPDHRPRLKAAARKLENHEIAVKFDGNGNITSIQTLDDEPTEFVLPGQLANLFQILDDRPLFWDAWDTESYAQETAIDLVKSDSFEVVEKGPARVAVEITKTFGKSKIRQRISLGPTPGIRFDTEVDWQEDHKFLKVAFPVNVNATKASFEIQFGHVERPTHKNTSWDVARFEVCAQKWADVSDGGYGLAILNQGKYGHDVQGSTLRLSLLRSPKAPDPICDRGVHRFTYVVFPHFDQVAHSDVVRAAYAVNAEPHVVPLDPSEGSKVQLPPFVHVDSRDLMVETVKKAEDSNHLVVRLYEVHNRRGTATLSVAQGIKRAWNVDLNEIHQSEVDVVDSQISVSYKPFEIITLMIEI